MLPSDEAILTSKSGSSDRIRPSVRPQPSMSRNNNDPSPTPPRPYARARAPKPPPENPVTMAVTVWLDSTLPPARLHSMCRTFGGQIASADLQESKALILARSPRRWVVYPPMVLFPSGSFSSAPWPGILQVLASEEPQLVGALWASILDKISQRTTAAGGQQVLTRLAVNEAIPSHLGSTPGGPNPEDALVAGAARAENTLRSPSGLRILHGDFGPAISRSPSAEDLSAAFWVTTKQNGVHQCWAPRYTMFSRGNIKEKARLLGFRDDKGGSPVSKWAVDLYAGIGYFVFSYARLGMRVLCWEVNPWSVEGLRRGAVANGWGVHVVRDGIEGEMQTVRAMLSDAGDEGDKSARIIVFQEDNSRAELRLRELRGATSRSFNVLHVNCGLLPTSADVWWSAWRIVQAHDTGASWLHLHENVGVKDVESRRGEIQALFSRWTGDEAAAQVGPVKLVKTFAPGVWHCVFDVCICSTRDLQPGMPADNKVQT